MLLLVQNLVEIVDLHVLVVTVSTALAILSKSKVINLIVDDLKIERNFLRGKEVTFRECNMVLNPF